MKQLIVILLIVLSYGGQLIGQPELMRKKELFPIIENGLWGYIDKSGKVIIKPKYHSAGQFSEGLSPVRLDGTYGYIHKFGDFIIEPQYDVAYSFEGAQAKVYIDGKPYYIDQKGEIAFEHN